MSDPRPHRSLLVSRRLLVALGFVFVMPWIGLVFVIREFRPAVPAPAATPPAPTATGALADGTVAAKPGPWGNLVYSRILIEPPDDLVGRTPQPRGPMTWYFPGYSAGQLTELWKAAKVSPAAMSVLESPVNRKMDGNLIEVRVPYEVILGFSEETRTVIYDALAVFPQNEFFAEPFRFRSDGVDEWLADSGVKPEIVALVKQLLYRRGPAILFSDLELVLSRLPSLAERTLLIKTLARKSTLLVRLVIDENSDIDALAEYWGRGLRSKDIRPLLNSLKRPGVVNRIDIAHLLPRFARARLYSYPSEAEAADLQFMDCHWTSLNFFNLEPDPRYKDTDTVSMTINRDYRLVSDRPQLGDLLLFVNRDGTIIHSCIYVADDIVFSKNGTSAGAPWILMNVSGVEAIYPSKEPLEVQRYRLKNLP